MGAIDSKENGPENMDDMPLLSRLLAQEHHVPDLPEYGLYNTIYAYLQKEIPPLLAASSYAHRVELWQEIEHIFDRFHHTHDASRESTGLGLAIVQEIARRHAIEIDVRSKEGEGTTFIFRFPKA